MNKNTWHTWFATEAPATEQLQSACGGPKVQKTACSSALEALTAKHLLLVILNVCMFIYPIVKFKYNRPSAPQKAA